MAKPQIFKHPESAPRVSLGRMVVPEPEHDELILTFGKRDSGTRGGLSVVGGTAKSVLTSEERRLNAEISTALANVRSHSLPKQEGPYADTDDAVLEMAKALAVHANRLEDLVVIATDILRPRGTDQEGEMAERQIRRTLNNPDYMFVVDPSYIPSSLPTAGALLTEPERLSNDDLSGAQERILTHPFEVITLTIACLREIATLKGFKGEIFPAFANSRNPENPDEILHIPVVAVLDQAAEFPLRTFGVGPVHPPVGSFDILSDQAVLGFQHGLLAHNRVRAMCKDIADKLENHEPLPSTDEIDAVALEVGQLIAQFHAAYPGDIVNERLAGIEHTFTDTMFTVNMYINGEQMEGFMLERAQQLEADRLKGKKTDRANELVAAAKREKKKGVFGMFRSSDLSDAEIDAINANVDKEFAGHVLTREEKGAIGEQVQMEFAPNSRVANNLRESAQTSAMEAGSIFIQNVLQSMARELAKMGIDLTPEAE